MAPALAKMGRKKGKCVFRKLMAASATWRNHPAASKLCVTNMLSITLFLSHLSTCFASNVAHALHEHLCPTDRCASAPNIQDKVHMCSAGLTSTVLCCSLSHQLDCAGQQFSASTS